MNEYQQFIERKSQLGGRHGFAPVFMPDYLFDFQTHLTTWAIEKGRAAIFADCGLGKTPMQLVWAQNVIQKTNRPVLIASPLAVSHQIIREADKFSIDAVRSIDGSHASKPMVVVTNYERLEHFNPADFAGMVCDESSILKNFNGKRRGAITQFMRKMKYRLLCTATAAPNDYVELGTSSEALGELGHMDMLGKFFKNDNNTVDTKGHWKGHAAPRAFTGQRWRFKGHAEEHFWRWICSWARAVRRPSDLGFDDGRFVLPPLTEHEHVVKARSRPDGYLFDLPARGIREEREERRRTIEERCEKIAELISGSDRAIVWCHLNAEGDRLSKMIDRARQVRGSDPDELKEERLLAFADGDLPVLVTKPRIGAWGLNLQGCAHVACFPSHSYEQYYQGVRRCWRFGQTRPVRVDNVSTDGEAGVLRNLKRKAMQADRMFSSLVAHMNDAMRITCANDCTSAVKEPGWLSASN